MGTFGTRWGLALVVCGACSSSAAPLFEAERPGGAAAGAGDAGAAAAGDSGSPAPPKEEAGTGGGDPYAEIFAHADRTRLENLLKDMTGYNPVQLGGQTARIAERYTPASKALWRAYFTQYYTALGATVRETTFPVKNLVGETQGHNMEAVFAGRSADTIVAIVHYDSTGAAGKEAQNPAVDDNMTPMAIQMEAARLLAQYNDRRELTVRFVATDYEEITTIEGGKAYVAALQDEAKSKGFKIVAAVDGELSGWNCWKENKCGAKNLPPAKSTFTVASCTEDGTYAFPELAKRMADATSQYSPLRANLECDNDTNGSELYNFWRAGVPAFYFMEYGQDGNTYFDEGGDDTLAHIDLDYFYEIGRVVPVLIAKLVGIAPR